MKLELKHLSAYLPYGLEVLYNHTKERGVIRNLYSIENYEDIKIGINFLDGEHIWMFKPILRPFSDLTKEIEHNGEKFVPTKALSMWDLQGITVLDIPYIPVNLYELLLKWHFDVFGLIEKNLAININIL